MKQIKRTTSLSAIMLFMAFAMTACTIDRNTGGDNPGDIIRFKVDNATGASSKVTGTNFNVDDEISVFAPGAGAAINASDYTSKDRRYVADGTNNFTPKTGHEIRYTSVSQKLDFYVFHPAVGPTAQVVQADYTVIVDDLKDQTADGNVMPYMYSNNAKNKTVGDVVVALEFRYVMSKVTITINFDPTELLTLTDVAFYSASGLKESGVIDLTVNNHATMATGTGNDVTESNPIRFAASGLLTTGSTVGGYIMPGAVVKPMIKMTFVKIDGVSSATYVAEIAAADYTFVAGKEYIYTVSVGELIPVSIGGTIQDWVPVVIPEIPAE